MTGASAMVMRRCSIRLREWDWRWIDEAAMGRGMSVDDVLSECCADYQQVKSAHDRRRAAEETLMSALEYITAADSEIATLKRHLTLAKGGPKLPKTMKKATAKRKPVKK